MRHHGHLAGGRGGVPGVPAQLSCRRHGMAARGSGPGAGTGTFGPAPGRLIRSGLRSTTRTIDLVLAGTPTRGKDGGDVGERIGIGPRPVGIEYWSFPRQRCRLNVVKVALQFGLSYAVNPNIVRGVVGT